MTATEIASTYCRNCLALCPLLVTLEDGRPVKVTGNPEVEVFEGYSCPKGRAMPEQHNDPSRLLMSQKRREDGSFATIDSSQAIEEVAEKLRKIIEEHGPRSVALYAGIGSTVQYVGSTMAVSLMRAVGSPMIFTAATIDKPAEKISVALHGNWQAGAQSFSTSDTWMLVGANPVITKSNGVPYHNPGMRLKDAVNRGMKLIVIDPRRTETAKRAHVHLQARPGEDPTILAGIIHIIIAENLFDRDFVKQNAVGFEELKKAVGPYTPDYVSERAGIAVDDLLEAARTFGRGKRGGVVCSTGPSFSTHSNVSYYLALCLNTLCGRWGHAGDAAAFPNVLLPAYTPKAQPQSPYPVFGDIKMRFKGLKQNASGMPTAILADEMLLEGEGQIKALICLGGNPVSSWPDQRKAEAGLKKLDLLVQLDVIMSATARLAHYVIATPMPLEVPGMTYIVESAKYVGVSRGLEIPWAQYTPALAKHPAGSDLLEEHAFFFRVAQKMGLDLEWMNDYSFGKMVERPAQSGKFDMSVVPSMDELFEIAACNSRVPLSEVKKYPNGNLFDISVPIEPRDADCTEMLQIGDPMMMAELAEIRAEDYRIHLEDSGYPFQLVSRRNNNFMNSFLTHLPGLTRKKPYNPVFMHPADLAALGLSEEDVVTIRSRAGSVSGVVQSDDSLRRGVVAMTHGFGVEKPEGETDPRHGGSNVNLLVIADENDPISGIPRMSAIPVAIERAQAMN